MHITPFQLILQFNIIQYYFLLYYVVLVVSIVLFSMRAHLGNGQKFDMSVCVRTMSAQHKLLSSMRVHGTGRNSILGRHTVWG